MSAVQEFKCPSCGGTMVFNSSQQKLVCEYCGTEMDVSAAEELSGEDMSVRPDSMDWEALGGSAWREGEKPRIRIITCASCGGELMTDENTAATSCPFCGNKVVIKDQVEGTLRPDYVIPFKLDKEQAKEAYRNHLKGKFLLPKSFASGNHVDEMKGIYVPFWVFDTDANADFRYKARRENSWIQGDYIYTRISHYSLVRRGSIGFSHVPVDASKDMPDTLMQSLEPYDFGQAVDFNTAYLAGYLADRYDIGMEESSEKANARIRQSTENAIDATATGYMGIQRVQGNIQLFNAKAKYVLYPVWLLNTTWQGKTYTFAMNGQTGKFVGDLPSDNKKFFLTEALVAIGAAAAALAVMFFL